MKTISFLSVFVLAAVLSACSSGSSDETDGTTSTNTVPTMDNAADSGTASDPSDDQPTTTDGMDTGDDTGGTSDDGASDDGASEDDGAATGEADTSNTADGATESSAGSDDTDNDAGKEPESTGGSASGDGGTDETENTDGDASEGGTDTTDSGDTTGGTGVSEPDGGNDDSGSEGSGADASHPIKPDPKIDPNSALGKMQARIKKLTGRTLIALNQSLSQGEMRTAQQEQCLGTYDPAIGEPLLSIDCEQPLATGEVAIFARIASFQDTEQCRADLQNAIADACTINQAEFRVNTLFTVPETGTPQPKPGAILSYNIVQDRLTVENLKPPLKETFRCEYDLTNGNAVGGDPASNCYSQLTRIVDLINEHLDAEH